MLVTIFDSLLRHNSSYMVLIILSNVGFSFVKLKTVVTKIFIHISVRSGHSIVTAHISHFLCGLSFHGFLII